MSRQRHRHQLRHRWHRYRLYHQWRRHQYYHHRLYHHPLSLHQQNRFRYHSAQSRCGQSDLLEFECKCCPATTAHHLQWPLCRQTMKKHQHDLHNGKPYSRCGINCPSTMDHEQSRLTDIPATPVHRILNSDSWRHWIAATNRYHCRWHHHHRLDNCHSPDCRLPEHLLFVPHLSHAANHFL